MEELKKQGWNITNEGFNLLSENGTVKDLKKLSSNALNTDIKEFGDAVLSSEVKKGRSGKIILQIQKIRNVSAPKAKEDSQAAPRMLKLILTDGHTNCQAVEVGNVSALSRTHTPPGTKILINNSQISSGSFLLDPSSCSLLGGKVPALCEKWELVKDMSNHVRTLGGTDGAPPWVNFGEKIICSTFGDKFKSLVSKEVKEGVDEFALQRQDAIAVASTGAVKKVFGGGGGATKPPPVEQQNNHFGGNKKFGNFREKREEQGRNFKGRREPREKNLEKPQKPVEKVSLFDFLEDKLLVSEVKSDNNYRQETPKVREPPKHFNRDFNTHQNFKFPNENNRQQNSKFSSENNRQQNFKFPNENNRQVSHAYRNDNQNNMDRLANNFRQVSLNGAHQFAKKTLQQHLNLDNKSQDHKSNSDGWQWKVGDLCMAKYWEDGKYYNATIVNLTERTCVVQFNGYGNVEEILKFDCIPVEADPESKDNTQQNKGPSGFRSHKRQYTNNYRSFNRAS